MDLGEKIYQLRIANGLSQEELADRLAVSRQSVSKWETGAAIPDLERLMRLCDLFGVTLDEITGRSTASKVDKADAVPSVTPFSTAKTVGYILLAVSLTGALLFVLVQLYHLLLIVAMPLLMCSVLCLTLPRRAGYWCLWAVWLAMEYMLVFGVSIVTGARLFPGLAFVLMLIIGTVGWISFRNVTVRVNRRRTVGVLLGWLGYVGLTAGLFWWVWHYGFIGGAFELLIYYGVSTVMTALLAGLFTYTLCFLKSWIEKRKGKGC